MKPEWISVCKRSAVKSCCSFAFCHSYTFLLHLLQILRRKERVWICDTVTSGENFIFSGCETSISKGGTSERKQFSFHTRACCPRGRWHANWSPGLCQNSCTWPLLTAGLQPVNLVWDEHPLTVFNSLYRYTLRLPGSSFQLPQFSELT